MTQPSFVEAAGLRFAYLEEGEGPLVLMVHGFPDTAHSWDHIRPVLAARGYRVVAPFTRGYAPTEVPADGAYDSDSLGGDLVALVEALGHDEAVLVAHDWGASAAYSAATLAPERWRLLVTMAVPHPAVIRPSPRLLWVMRHFLAFRLPGAAARLRRNDFALVDELVRRWSPAWKDIPAEETAAVKKAFADPKSLEAALDYYRAAGGKLSPGQRKKIAVPTVSIAGLDDIIEPAVYHAAARRFLGHYEVVEVPGGHFMHREHPEAFEETLLGVLDRLAPPQPRAPHRAR